MKSMDGIYQNKAPLFGLAIVFACLTSCSSQLPGSLSGLSNNSSSGSGSSSISFQSDSASVLNYSASTAKLSTITNPIQSVQDPSGQFSLASSTSAGAGGNMGISITDSPIPGVQQVLVTFTKITLKGFGDSGALILLDHDVQVDLLSLQNGLEQLFGSLSLPAGHYHDLRFYISQVIVVTDNISINVVVPNEILQNGVRVYGAFEINDGDDANLLVDVDVSRMLVWGLEGPILRPVMSLRRIHFNPAAIHFVAASDGTMSLIGPPQTVRAKTWLQLTDVSGATFVKRANADGSFQFDEIKKIYGTVELAVLNRIGHGHDDDERDWDDHDHRRGQCGDIICGNRHQNCTKLAWIDLIEDFVADPKYPNILASNLDALFKAALTAAGGSVSTFLSYFGTDAFTYLAGLYLQVKGIALPSGFTFPNLPVPYAFALTGPEYELPGYALSENSVGYFSGGPQGTGCSDARVVFEGPSPNNDYQSLGADAAVSRMEQAGLPFTGLLAEYESVCHGNDLATLSCATLGSLAGAASNSLPSDPLSTLNLALNTPRGGLLTQLLACMSSTALNPISLPSFPSAQPGCWMGCGNESAQNYLAGGDLLAIGAANSIIGDPASVLDLDSLVLIANNAGIAPLILAASYIADNAPSKVHGYVDRNAPVISNISPASGLVVTDPNISISADVNDRSTVSITINGQSASFSLGTDGVIHVQPVTLTLLPGSNVVMIEAEDLAGNIGSASITATYNPPLPPPPAPSPSPSPSPSSSPSPSPTPSPSPSPILVSGVDPMCTNGTFAMKPVIRVGLSIDPNDPNYATIVNAFQTLGYPATVYSQVQIANGQPITDGITVLAVSRVATLTAVSSAYVTGVRNFIASGGSVIGEYDGAALFFTQFTGSTALIMNLTPAFTIFAGDVAGGGSLLPLSSSTFYVSDVNDPLMAGMPASFNVGVRQAFAISGFNTNWLHTSGTFTSQGSFGLVPAGTFPAAMSAECGGGRIALLPMNDMQVATTNPVNILVTNALRWVTGN